MLGCGAEPVYEKGGALAAADGWRGSPQLTSELSLLLEEQIGTAGRVHTLYATVSKPRATRTARWQRLAEERPDHFDVAGHSDLRVSLQRVSDQRSRLFAITRSAAIQ